MFLNMLMKIVLDHTFIMFEILTLFQRQNGRLLEGKECQIIFLIYIMAVLILLFVLSYKLCYSDLLTNSINENFNHKIRQKKSHDSRKLSEI